MSDPSLDSLKAQLAIAIRGAVSGLDYQALYPATVEAQAGQTLDLRPDSDKVPPISGVPLRLGLPGIEVQVAPGARVLLGFENGDPHRPMATLWEKSQLLSLTIDHGLALNLGGSTRGSAIIGEQLNAAIATLGTAIAAAFTAMAAASIPPGTGPVLAPAATAAASAVTAALGVFSGAAAAALAPSVRLK